MGRDGEKTFALRFGGRPHAIVRLRDWERVAIVFWELCVTAVGTVALANLLGAALPTTLMSAVETATAAATLAGLTAVLRATNRYDGELEDTRPSCSERFIARLRRRN